jgi:phosphinothricin acetyltransferase
MADIILRSMEKEHWPSVQMIYQMGIDTGIATFEFKAPEMYDWDKKCRLVALIDDTVVGWAALQPVSKRDVYAGVAEETVYVHTDYYGRGIGGLLLDALVLASEQEGFWMLTVSIFRSNRISIRLHENYGFKTVGIREKVAKKDGAWTDTVLMDRRSKVVGID